MLKFIRNIVICIVLLSLLIVGIVGIGQLIPYQASETSFVTLRDKYNRLVNREEPNIILVGGSSVLMGFDSKKIEKEMNMPTLNNGLNAALKREFNFNLCKQKIIKGDVIILAFEYNAFAPEGSLSGDTVWNFVDNDINLIKLIPSSQLFNLIRYYPIFLIKKVVSFLSKSSNVPSNKAYSCIYYDEYGDCTYEREKNMRSAEEIKSNAIIEIKKDIISSEAIKSFTNFREECESKGATVYATCPCVDEYAVKYIENGGKDFKEYFEEQTGIKMISEPTDYILNTNLFYDTDYHLNTNGVQIRTDMFIKDLINELNK